jgi:hypothetical protein
MSLDCAAPLIDFAPPLINTLTLSVYPPRLPPDVFPPGTGCSTRVVFVLFYFEGAPAG